MCLWRLLWEFRKQTLSYRAPRYEIEWHNLVVVEGEIISFKLIVWCGHPQQEELCRSGRYLRLNYYGSRRGHDMYERPQEE